jgi:MoaA/NifB/PqqE/SkfB family radical SAM enzyme
MSLNVRANLRLLSGVVAGRFLGRPVLLSHLVTGRCACSCETCLWRGLTDPAQELSAAEAAVVYRDAVACGMRINSIWGGEPLVRGDLPEILQASRRAGMMTVLISSGHHFLRRFDEVVPHADAFIFSLDHLGGRHDAMRGRPGLFEEVRGSIVRLRGRAGGQRVFINTAVSRLNVEAVPGLARLARAWSTPIYFNPIETGMLGGPDSPGAKRDLALGDDELSGLAGRLLVLKGRGYPIANSRTYLRGFLGGKQPFRCHARKFCIELRPNGDLVDCLDRFRPLVNVRRERLTRFLGRPEVRRLRLADVPCHFCNNANVIDTSHIWELRPESLLSLLGRNLGL